MAEVDALSRGESYQPKVFQYQIAYNVIPQIGGEAFEGYTSEEMKMQNEGRKILHLPDMNVACTCVRVPVVRSHSISAAVHFAHHISVDEARAAIAAAPGLWTILTRCSIPCRSTRRIRISCSSAASVPT